MVLLSVHVLAALYAWANEATNTKKNDQSFTTVLLTPLQNWIIVESFSLLRIFNVYVHGMRIDVICYKLNTCTLSLKLFKFFFQQLH